jgi:hypothetical protein
MTTPTEFAQLTETIEAQARLLRELASDLSESQSAYVAMNLEAIYSHAAAQTELCERLRGAERARASAWRAARAALPMDLSDAETGRAGSELKNWIAESDPALAERLRRALTDMALAEGQVRHLHQAHTVMLEGSRRTIQMLANALTIFSPMYAAPRNAAPGAQAGRP